MTELKKCVFAGMFLYQSGYLLAGQPGHVPDIAQQHALVDSPVRGVPKPLENSLDKRIAPFFWNSKCHLRCPVQKCLDLLQGL